MAEPISPPTGHTVLARAVHRNQRRTAAILATAAGVVLVVGLVVVLLAGLGIVGVAVVVLLAVAVAVLTDRNAGRVAVAVTGARPAEGRESLRFHNLTEGLCIAAGLPKPQLYVIDDEALNAFTAGPNPKRAVLAVTTGLLDTLNRIELEGVLAHELSQIRNLDTATSSVAVVGLAGPVLLADLGRRPAGGDATPRSALVTVLARPAVVLLVLAPVARWALRRAIDPRRALDADAAGVRLTRYPPGLTSALTKLRDQGTAVRRATRATDPLWLASPLPSGGAGGGSFDTHPPLDERIQQLEKL